MFDGTPSRPCSTDIIETFEETQKSALGLSAIESYIDRIPSLSEQFLYLNDDMMFANNVDKSDFFSHDASPKMALQIPFGKCYLAPWPLDTASKQSTVSTRPLQWCMAHAQRMFIHMHIHMHIHMRIRMSRHMHTHKSNFFLHDDSPKIAL